MTSFNHREATNTSSSVLQTGDRDVVSNFYTLDFPRGFHKSLGPSADTLKAMVPEENLEGLNPKLTGLMVLPRELRDKIYGYLLCIDRFATVMHDRRNAANLDLSILRVSKTLHGEASKIFYQENPWVCVTIQTSLLRALCDQKIGNKKGFPGSKPAPLAKCAHITAVGAVTMRVISHMGPKAYRVPLLVSLYAMPRLCRLLAAYWEIQEVDIIVHLNTMNFGKVDGVWQERLLDCCTEARGFRSANVLDALGNKCHVELATLMMSRFTSFQEIVDRVSIYQDHALRKKKLGRFSEACYDHQDCRDFIFWFMSSNLRRNLSHYNSVDGNKNRSILPLLHATSVSCAVLHVKLGELDRAVSAADWILALHPDNRRYLAEPEVWFLCGLRDLAKGSYNGAAYCFLQTLRKEPGHSGAHEAIDEMRSRLGSCTALTERIILHNIEHVLLPFRHLTHDSAATTEAEYIKFIEKWYVGKMVDDSYGLRSITRCSTGRNYGSISPVFGSNIPQ